jgi:bile acid:Na+ symporter, BASS family
MKNVARLISFHHGDILMKALLRWAGQNGALIVIAGVLIGLAIPATADLARPYLSIAIFIFTFGSFLKFDTKALGGEVAHMRRNLLIILWATFGIPLIMFVIILLGHPGPELTQGLLFWALVPASPACVAFAAILKLNIPIALMTTVVGTAASPFYIPALASLLGGYHLDIDPLSTCAELVFLIGGAFVASMLVKRFAGTFVKENPEAMTGVAVCAMFLAGMGSMKGMQAHLLAQPQNSLAFVAMAYLLLFGAEILGTLLFWRFGRTAALTAGLVSGTRTITLAWVVLGDRVLPLADLFLAAGMIAKYTAPGLTKWLLTRILASGEAAAPAPLAVPQPASSEPAQ